MSKPPIPPSVFFELVTNIREKLRADFAAACDKADGVHPDPEVMKSIGFAYVTALLEQAGNIAAGIGVPFVKVLEISACTAATQMNLNENEEKIHDFIHKIANEPLDGSISVGVLHGEEARAMQEHMAKFHGAKSPVDVLLDRHSFGKSDEEKKPN